MKLHFREAFDNFRTEFATNRKVRQDIGNIVSAVPGVILSVKAVRTYGLMGSMRPSNALTTMRGNKISSALYCAGLGYALWQQSARYYEAWKIEQGIGQFPEIVYGDGKLRMKMATGVPAPTKNEIWAADLAEGDVTIFDRLMEVRAQAIKLVEEKGLEIKPNPDSPYFDVRLAREELDIMEPEELARTEATLNRRILALATDGEGVDEEEKRLHASLVLLEEELDVRRLVEEEEVLSEREERLRREGAKLVHPANQHMLKRQGFNTGFSTTVEDLIAEPENEGITRIKEALAKQTPGDVVYLVQLKRYTNRDSIGLHLIVKADPGVRWDYGHRTIGLFTKKDADQAVVFFRELDVPGYVPGDLFSEADEKLQTYIREQVIPLEWKAMTDSELDDAGVFINALQVPQV